MHGLRCYGVILAVLTGMASVGQAHDLIVNGYTYAAPSVYLQPPVVVYQPVMMVPARPVVTIPAPVVYAEPAYVSHTLVPVAPSWNYAPTVVVPTRVRERTVVRPHSMDYRYREYVPGRGTPVYTYKVDANRAGVRVREYYR